MTSNAHNCLSALLAARRPVLIYGWGIRLSKAESVAEDFARFSGIPVCATWGAADVLCDGNPDYVGTFGTHGVRYANFAIQNADVVVSIGSRLDTKATGSPVSSFAPKAQLFMVDIDQTEIDKFQRLGREVIGIKMDAKKFLDTMMAELALSAWPFQVSPRAEWHALINSWKERYSIVLPEYEEEEGVNPYVFVRELSKQLKPDDVIVSDTGCALGWMMQAFQFKGQRFIHAYNNTPMGYGLPAAVGAAFATGRRVVLCTGDGGLSVNITELATIARHNLPIKIILFNNRGHAMCRQTQRQWLGGEYPATSYEGGLACPNFAQIVKAYGIRGNSWSIYAHHTRHYSLAIQVKNGLAQFFEDDTADFLELKIGQDQGITPQVKFGHKLEDGEPLLPREEIEQIMKEAA